MKTEVHAPGFHAFAQQPLFNARCRAMISLCDNGLSQQTAFLLRNAAVPELFAGGSGLLENDVVRAALDDGGSGNERDLRLLLELRNGERAASIATRICVPSVRNVRTSSGISTSTARSSIGSSCMATDEVSRSVGRPLSLDESANCMEPPKSSD